MRFLDNPFVVGIMALACAMLYLGVNVAGNYDGRVSGLFYTAAEARLPPEVDAHTRRVPDRAGYDAQFYHLMAHDPLLTHGYAMYADNARLRWRRIAIPAMANLLSFGNSSECSDAIYVFLELAFTFLGALWLSRFCRTVGLPARLGLAFLCIPATLVSLDRMTIDLPLAAITIGVFLYANASRKVLFPLLVLAPLVRETGVLLIVGWCTYTLVQRRDWRSALQGSLGAVPALAWWAYVQARTPPDATSWIARYPFSGLLDRTFTIGRDLSGPGLWLRIAHLTEILALAGIWAAFALTFLVLWRRQFDLFGITAAGFLAFASMLGKYDIWDSAYATGRTMSPLLIILLLVAMRKRRPLFALPTVLILPRIALQYQAQVTSAIRSLG